MTKKTKTTGKELSKTDSWENAITGIGTAKDKSSHTGFALNGKIPYTMLEYLYEQDWIVGRICDSYAYEMTRKWVKLISDATPEKMEEVKEALDEFDIQEKFREAITWSRLYGGSAIMMIVNDGKEPNEELDISKVKELINLIVIDAKILSPKTWNTDVTDKDYGKPEVYQFATLDGTHKEVHTSRLLKFYGIKVSDRASRRHKGWGSSYVMRALDSIKTTQMLDKGIATLVAEAKYDTIYIPNLTELLMGAASEDLTNLYSNINMQKSITNSLLLDSEMKQERTTTQFSGLPEIQKNQLTNLATAVDIPEFILAGRNNGGLNAGQKEQLLVWYDKIFSYQTAQINKPLKKLLEVFAQAEGWKDEITFEFVPLFQMNEEEMARIKQTNAQTDSTYIREGVVTPEEVRKDLVENKVYLNIDEENEADDELAEEEDEKSIIEGMSDDNEAGDNSSDGADDNSDVDAGDSSGSGSDNKVPDKLKEDGLIDSYFKIKIIDKAKNYLIKIIKG